MLKSEQETIIRFDRESDKATVYTADPTMAGRLRKLGWTLEVTGRLQGEPIGWTGLVPKAMVKVRKNAPSVRKGNPAALAAARQKAISTSEPVDRQGVGAVNHDEA